MRRILVLAAPLALVGIASASFELVLVADNGTNTNATRKIHRFDANSSVYLGSFGSFGSNILDTHLNQATNRLYVVESTAMSEWDYNTGEFIASYVNAGGIALRAVRPDRQRLAFFDGLPDFGLVGFPNAINGTFTGLVAGAQYRSGIWTTNTEIVAFDGANRVFRRVAVNAAGTAATATAASSPYLTGSFGQMARNAGTNELIMAAGTDIKVIDSVTLTGFSYATPLGTTTAVASGHEGYMMASTNAGGALVTRYDRFNNFRGQFGNGILTSPISMQTVLAPEPGTMIALGGGVLALLRRRRKA
jgi:hypothetical protein